MRRPPTIVSVPVLLVLVAAAPAQAPGGARSAIAALTDLRVPVHAEAVGGATEYWAAGHDYKVSFHDGFTFYPVLGAAAPRNLPLRWRTEDVTAGGLSLADQDAPRHARSDWRYEYVSASYKESYDVVAAGVEQSFTVFARPATPGDLVVVGRVETELVGAPRAGEHGPVAFRDAEGRVILEYGAAFAIDARGDRVAIDTAVAGDRITLTVPGAWLERAAFPVVVDPLTATRIAVLMGSKIEELRLSRETISATSNVLLTFLRSTSSTDLDLYAYLLDSDFGNGRPVRADVSGTTVDQVHTAFVGGAGRWIITYMERFRVSPGWGPASARAYFHDRANTRLNSGVAITVPHPTNELLTHLTVGGARSGARAMVVQTTGDARVYGVVVDASARKVAGTTRLYALSSTFKVYPPSINAAAYSDADGWLVTWMNALPLYGGFRSFQIFGLRVYPTLQRTSALLLDSGNADPSLAGPSSTKVDGRLGRYLVAYRVERHQVRYRRVDWPGGRSTPGLWPARRVTHGLAQFASEVGFDVAFDTNTRSHWALAVREPIPNRTPVVWIRRLGYSGGVLETRAVSTDYSVFENWDPAVAFDDDASAFLVAWRGKVGVATGFAGTRLVHDAAAGVTRYGTTCTSAVPSAAIPYAGHGDWFTQVVLGRPRAPAFVLFSLRRAALPLGGGCFLNADPAAGVIGAFALDQAGTARLTVPLPDSPSPVIGDGYVQWAYVDNGRLLTTQGLQVRIRL